MVSEITNLAKEVARCAICADQFAETATGHAPRPVFWVSNSAPILIAGQAPGARVHQSGVPFDDPSGERLRDWLGVTREEFYDRDLFAILPMAFCFPGYDEKGSDLPPPRICARTWRARALDAMPQIRLKILIGGYAIKYHLGRSGVTDTVRDWRAHAPETFVLPHPSWRNTGWLKKNPWFGEEVLPVLRARVREVLT